MDLRAIRNYLDRGLLVLAAASSMSLTSACKSTFEMDEREELVGTWGLEEVDGLGECSIQAGDIDVLPDDKEALSGEFWWSAQCAHVGAIDELASIEEVIVDVEGSQYQIVFAQLDPSGAEEPREWDCIIDGPDLDCVEIAGEEVILYSFLFVSE